MRVFVTGASGLVGSSVIPALVTAGHTVVALVRSEESGETVKANGASEIVIGSTSDLQLLQEAVQKVDAVIHLAFNHDLAFTGKAIQACEEDRQAIQTMCDALVSSAKDGTQKHFLGTSGLLGVLGEDETAPEFENPNLPRYLSDRLVTSYAEKDLLHTHVVRLSPVTHGPKREHPFISTQIKVAKERGVAAYIGDSNAAWNACHVDDAAQLYVLALEGKAPNGKPLHAVSEQDIPLNEIAEFIGKRLDVRVESISKEEGMARYGFIGFVMSLGGKRSAKYTQEWLGWKPTKYGLFKEMENYAW